MSPVKLFLAALPLLLLPACGEAPEPDTAAPAAKVDTGPKPDASATLACRHFRNVVGDIDVMTTGELREKVKEVHDKARVSENDGVPEAARGMLAAVTADDGEAFMASATDMAAACSAVGV